MNRINEIIGLFFKLGLIAFGGPAAHIAMMHKEVVDKRKWISEQHFLDLVGATSLIPGPNSTEMVMHCGHERGGVLGLFGAGLSFIIPATVLTGIIAYLYTVSATIPNFDSYIFGIKPVVIILIFEALRKLWKKAIKSKDYIFIVATVVILSFTGMSNIFILAISTAIGFMYLQGKETYSAKAVEPISLFLIFLKIGSILYGSGYVLIAYLQDELVRNRSLLTMEQLADAIGFGQFTPGPVLSTSTFIGYILSGTPGAIAATVGIFLPSFLFVWLLGPLIPKMRNSQKLSKVLDAVNAASLGLMLYALIPMGKATFNDTAGIVTFILILGIYLKFKKISTVKLVGMAMILGFGVSSLI